MNFSKAFQTTFASTALLMFSAVQVGHASERPALSFTKDQTGRLVINKAPTSRADNCVTLQPIAAIDASFDTIISNESSSDANFTSDEHKSNAYKAEVYNAQQAATASCIDFAGYLEDVYTVAPLNNLQLINVAIAVVGNVLSDGSYQNVLASQTARFVDNEWVANNTESYPAQQSYTGLNAFTEIGTPFIHTAFETSTSHQFTGYVQVTTNMNLTQLPAFPN